jgi:hypothetical protein
MNANHRPHWDTASSDHSPNTTPAELLALQEHLRRLQVPGRRAPLRRAGEARRNYIGVYLTAKLAVVALLLLGLLALLSDAS